MRSNRERRRLIRFHRYITLLSKIYENSKILFFITWDKTKQQQKKKKNKEKKTVWEMNNGLSAKFSVDQDVFTGAAPRTDEGGLNKYSPSCAWVKQS